jgi:tetratricopeptide (TPR) repeat protein
MSELRLDTITMPAAPLGPENPLPHLHHGQDAHARIAVDPAVPEEIRRGIGYGLVHGCLPYGVQDQYGRERRPRQFRVAILENDLLRATFLLDLGGRLWSLLDRTTGRELLYTNAVFQPANLAIRNAWFSGGVEWNIGMIGHTPLTCSPLFATRLRLPDGTPVLRLYEWERIRQLPYQLDCWLPDGSPFLFVRVRIRNPHPADCPMYWWSNIAVPEAPGHRILVPATSAYRLDYATGMKEIPIPHQLGTDISYPTQIDRCVDFFFRVQDGLRPWIASLDGAGHGLVQSSTARLRGRKLFVWGMAPGGRRWQEFLATPDEAYVEIQAGLARTQSECLPMPAGATWDWLEAYGPLAADPRAVHDPQWDHAWRAVQARLDEALPPATLAAIYDRTAALPAAPPEEVLHRGAGWGALERHRRLHQGLPPDHDDALRFDDASLGPEQAPWLALLRTGALPAADPAQPPGAWLVQPEWRALLEQAVAAGRGDHWLAWLHLGVMRYHAGDHAGARTAWERSLQHARTPWALRNLAVLDQQAGQPAAAAERYLAALHLAPEVLPLAAECGKALLAAERGADWLALLPTLPATVREHGRLRYLAAQAHVACGQYAAAEAILRAGLVVTDLQEGESSLTDLWFDLHARQLAAATGAPLDDALRARVRRDCPPPRHLDFRGQQS